VTNWVRDKGFGMGKLVGAIPSAVGGHHIALSHVGKVFRAEGDSLPRWRDWLRYVHLDQIWIWGLFCFFGMYFNVNLATAIVPAGTDLQGLGAGTYQAQYLRQIWPGFWFLTLFNGFWLLFKTQLGNTDILVRTVTDAVWMARQAEGRERLDIRGLYYGILIAFSLWSVIAIRLASPFQLFKFLANMAGVVLAIAGVQIVRVNRRFLPEPCGPPSGARAASSCARRSTRTSRSTRSAPSSEVWAELARSPPPTGGGASPLRSTCPSGGARCLPGTGDPRRRPSPTSRRRACGRRDRWRSTRSGRG
jgi:hypothetical protein